MEFKFLAIILALLNSAFGKANLPNYITEEELTAANGSTLYENDSSSLALLQNDDMVNANKIVTRSGVGNNLWPNAQVPYTLDPKFTADQRTKVAEAINNFHKNTCIRFIPKTNSHSYWLDILYDAGVCGLAQMCAPSKGSTWAKFGGSCVNAGVMTHELGHSLCLGHEMTRQDRDKWISFDTSKCSPPGKDNLANGLHKLYDYVSLEHYEGECYNGCYLPKQPGVTKCGSGGPLSVLDIELLNEVYGCKNNCLGYRYVNQRSLTSSSKMVEMGSESDGTPLYGCRVYHQGDIIPGKFHIASKNCDVSYGGGEHPKIPNNNEIEVLTNPYNNPLRWVKSGSLPQGAIRGGRTTSRETLYVVKCWNGKNWMPGKWQESSGAFYGFGGREYKCNKDQVEFLVCT